MSQAVHNGPGPMEGPSSANSLFSKGAGVCYRACLLFMSHNLLSPLPTPPSSRLHGEAHTIQQFCLYQEDGSRGSEYSLERISAD